MNLYIWDASQSYETAVYCAMAETVEQAMDLLKAEKSWITFEGTALLEYGRKVYPTIESEACAFCVSHSG